MLFRIKKSLMERRILEKNVITTTPSLLRPFFQLGTFLEHLLCIYKAEKANAEFFGSRIMHQAIILNYFLNYCKIKGKLLKSKVWKSANNSSKYTQLSVYSVSFFSTIYISFTPRSKVKTWTNSVYNSACTHSCFSKIPLKTKKCFLVF